jgi:hypothetical protein
MSASRLRWDLIEATAELLLNAAAERVGGRAAHIVVEELAARAAWATARLRID